MSGLPLLSHPPPDNGSNSPACRKCNKEFNFLFNRQKRCNHCGHAYCSSCADFQALMPRTGTDRGYDALPVCFFCMEMLTITASSKNKLRSLPLPTLRSYMKAYDIRTSGAVLEKDDLVEAILRAKGPNGCLLPAHEDYYRTNSVPQKSNEGPRPRNVFSRGARQETPIPTPQPQPQQRQYASSSVPPSPSARAVPLRHQHQQQHRTGVPSPQTPFSQPRPSRHNPPSGSPQPRAYPSHAQSSSSNSRTSASQTNFQARPPGAYPPANQAHVRYPPPQRPRSAAPTVPPTRSPVPPPPVPPPPVPPPTVPSLNSLLQMSSNDVAHLPISTLKSILFENRVRTTVGVLEKQDLVNKVIALVTDERRDREIREREEREEAERMEWARKEREKEEEERKAAERERKLMEDHPREAGEVMPENSTHGTNPPSSPPPSSYTDGLCVVCQDEHANMAIIDCGHLALCKDCSDIVMKTTRECPLCRTRIITEQRLLRIFKG